MSFAFNNKVRYFRSFRYLCSPWCKDMVFKYLGIKKSKYCGFCAQSIIRRDKMHSKYGKNAYVFCCFWSYRMHLEGNLPVFRHLHLPCLNAMHRADVAKYVRHSLFQLFSWSSNDVKFVLFVPITTGIELLQNSILSWSLIEAYELRGNHWYENKLNGSLARQSAGLLCVHTRNIFLQLLE